MKVSKIITAGIVLLLLLCTAAFLLTRPITGTWVCTEPLTEHSLLGDEVKTITIRPDGTAGFRSYATYIEGRYTIRDGNGRWEPAGFGKYHIAILQGYGSSCTQFSNCTIDILDPFDFTVGHDPIRDTIIYTEAGAPQFSWRWPFVRSHARDCSGPEGCTAY